MNTEFDVFLSYSRKDYQFVCKLEEEFNNAGISYWIDRKDIMAGMEIVKTIAGAIDNVSNNAKVFLCVISKNTSPFSIKELKYAINAETRYILPVYLDIEEHEIPHTLKFLLSDYNGIHIKSGDSPDKIIDRIHSMLGLNTWVFLSHSNKDFNKVKDLRNRLETRSYKPLLFFLKCLDDDDEIFELIKREISVRDRFILCRSKNSLQSKWVEKEINYIKSLGRPYEIINIDGPDTEINDALNRFDRRSTIYIWSTDNVFNQILARELIHKSFRVSLLPVDFYKTYQVTDKAKNGYSILLIDKKLSTEEADAIDLYAKRFCDYVYPIVVTEEGLENWELFKELQNSYGIMTRTYLLNSTKSNECIKCFQTNEERVSAIVKHFIELDNYINNH